MSLQRRSLQDCNKWRNEILITFLSLLLSIMKNCDMIVLLMLLICEKQQSLHFSPGETSLFIEMVSVPKKL